jgi:hypothetical protein
MTELPRSYTKVVRRITGYWGAFPLGQDLAPGMVGRKEDTTFVRDSWLADYPGYDPDSFAAPPPEQRIGVDAWVGEGVRVDGTGVDAGGGALPVAGRFRLSFSGANEGAVVCRGIRDWSFQNPRLVKQHVVDLYKNDQWDRRNILVMNVMLTDAAWVMVSSGSGQSVELSVSGALAPAGAPELLKAALGDASLDLTHLASATVGYSATLPEGGSPLFQAVRLRRFPRLEPRFTKGSDGVFTEPAFGDPDEADDT